jgi:hypothetical protein
MMKPRPLLPLASALTSGAGPDASLPVHVTFRGPRFEQTWTLRQIDANLPADWTPYEFLVIEFRASSSQKFELGLETPGGRLAKNIHPFPGVWVRASIPLRFYRQPAGDAHDMAATYNQPRGSYWINIHTSGHGPTREVTGLTVAMQHPVGSPTLEIRSVALAETDPGDAVLEGKPLIDQFGQYRHAEWPGKARSLGQLREAWAAEEAELRAFPSDPCEYGGFAHTQVEATGFFRVEKIDGRWWFVSPAGRLFFSAGVNGVGPVAGTRVAGREDLFAELVPESAGAGEGGGALPGAFYTWNLQRRFGDEWRGKWADLAARRMRAWGLNTIHYWGPRGEPADEPRIPYAQMLRGWQTSGSIMGMPDVYAEDFARRVDEAAARQLGPRREDPFMLGYFIGNEPPWPGRESQLCEAILAGPEGEMQKRLRTHLDQGDSPERRKGFVMAAFQRYLDTINEATRRHAPNHLNLGIRFGGDVGEALIRAARGFDVFSQNIYSYAPGRERLDRVYAVTGRPVLFGEFHIGAPERGMAAGLVQAMNQEERAAGYRYYVEQMAAHPAVVGTHWFQWIDQPSTGRNDGENYNIGFIDVTDQPYVELVAAARLTHARLLELHRGNIAPVDRHPMPSEAGLPGLSKP